MPQAQSLDYGRKVVGKIQKRNLKIDGEQARTRKKGATQGERKETKQNRKERKGQDKNDVSGVEVRTKMQGEAAKISVLRWETICQESNQECPASSGNAQHVWASCPRATGIQVKG